MMPRYTPTALIIFFTLLAGVRAEDAASRNARPVLELWYIGETTPSHPEIVVLNDRRMQIISPFGPERTQLEPENFRQLMNGLLKVDGLQDVTGDLLQHEIRGAAMQTGLTAEIPGAGDLVIRIDTGNEYREIRCHAVGVLANRFPELKCVKAMAAAQRRLENLRAITTVGGHEEASSIAELAVRQVEDHYSVKLPISVSDLSMVRALPDGSRFSQFVVTSKSQGQEVIQMVSITETPGQRPQVSMIGGPTIR